MLPVIVIYEVCSSTVDFTEDAGCFLINKDARVSSAQPIALMQSPHPTPPSQHRWCHAFLPGFSLSLSLLDAPSSAAEHPIDGRVSRERLQPGMRARRLDAAAAGRVPEVDSKCLHWARSPVQRGTREVQTLAESFPPSAWTPGVVLMWRGSFDGSLMFLVTTWILGLLDSLVLWRLGQVECLFVWILRGTCSSFSLLLESLSLLLGNGFPRPLLCQLLAAVVLQSKWCHHGCVCLCAYMCFAMDWLAVSISFFMHPLPGRRVSIWASHFPEGSDKWFLPEYSACWSVKIRSSPQLYGACFISSNQ